MREWTPSSPEELDFEQIAFLRERFDCQVEPAPGGLFTVRPRNKVGAAIVGGRAVQVRPKLAIDRVLFLLAYAACGRLPDDASMAASTELTAGVGALFATLCERATRSGVLAGYRDVSDLLHTVRGRIDMAEQVRRARPAIPVAVRFQEFDESIPENRLLLAGLEVLRRAPIHVPSVLNRLQRLRALFAAVAPATGTDVEIRWTRINQHYRPAVEMARLLVAGQSIDLMSGGNTTPALVLDMGEVFETFVRVALRESLRLTDDEFPSDDAAPRTTLDDRGQLVLKPDLTLIRDGARRFIGEVKYKVDPGSAKSSDRYQLLAYTVATGLTEATLIYADGPPQPTTHLIPGVNARLHLHRLDLAQPPTGVLDQIARIGEHIEACAARDSAKPGFPAKP
ncbi:McrC family protein [Actinokineospora fastidiosa]|uniref:McrBC 5-methylcytosine restriction system component n=1 Tax=Actinokineospora fastidiosa TaxID=1816 RepID=A0A918G1Y9_9PSEU|nr:hypothetical protein [Actinokineospora fastidiosa]GGS14463.1 McrBC 5-methylcytosine restriction system component [Actinokineospora fastidiosa]